MPTEDGSIYFICFNSCLYILRWCVFNTKRCNNGLCTSIDVEVIDIETGYCIHYLKKCASGHMQAKVVHVHANFMKTHEAGGSIISEWAIERRRTQTTTIKQSVESNPLESDKRTHQYGALCRWSFRMQRASIYVKKSSAKTHPSKG
jgi:hypothetical protein